MKENKYLSEERYKKNAKKLFIIAIVIYLIGFSIGGLLLYKGLTGASAKEKNAFAIVKSEIEQRRDILKNANVEESSDYQDGEAYELHVLISVLKPSGGYCYGEYQSFSESTREYCSLLNKSKNSFRTMSYIALAIAIIALAISLGSIFLMFSKAREITAFTVQQQMPVAKEGIDALAPNIGNIAKEISKGIKKGTEEDENK